MKKRTKTFIGVTAAGMGLFFASPLTASAHCDTPEGPTYDAVKASLEEENFNHIAYWVLEESEEELREVYDLSTSVMEKSDDEETDELAERYLFENFVRIHREGEGAPYTGISNEPVDPGVAAADESIAQESLQPLEENGFITDENRAHAETVFNELLSRKDFDIEDTEAGRAYVESYVTFTHLFEEGHGEAHEEGHDAHGEESEEAHEEAHVAAHEAQTADQIWEARSVEEIKVDLSQFNSLEQLQNYEVVWGDTLWGISEATDFSVKDLSETFNIANPDLIVANDTLAEQK